MKFIQLFSLLCITTFIELTKANPQIPTTSRTKNCPAEYVLSGKRCEKSEFVPLDFVCPPGTSNTSEDYCATFTRADRICPPGARKATAETCSETEVVPPTFNCNVGNVDETGRRCVLIQEVEPFCNPGLTIQNGECVKFTAVQKVCAAGFVLQGKECSRRTSFDSEPTCPPSFSFDGKRCVKTVVIPPKCPSGFVMEGDECLSTRPQVPAPCPSGFSVAGSSCQKQHQHPTSPICAPEMHLTGSVCTQEIYVPPTCPAGTKRSISGYCERQVKKVPTCEDGWKLVNSGGRAVCKSSYTFDPSPVCPVGYTTVHGKCKKVTSQSPSERCSHGVLSDGVCVSETSTTPLIQCPAGYQFSKESECIRDVEYDCSKTLKRVECEMPEFVSQLQSVPQSSKDVHHRTLKSDYKQKSVALVAPQKQQNKEPVCRDVTLTTPMTCFKTEKAPVEYICPDGSVTQGETCRVVSETQPNVVCTSGKFDQRTGQCITIAVVAPQFTCPEESKKQNGICVQELVEDASMVCPDGSFPSSGKEAGCVSHENEIEHPVRVVQQQPQLVCNIGEKRGNVCIDIERHPRGSVCPQGTEDRDGSGRCVVSAPLIAPPPIQVNQQPQYVCPDGKPASGKSCFSTEVIPVDHVCNGEGHLSGDRCVHSFPLVFPPPKKTVSAASPVCPSGYSFQGKDRCALTTTSPALQVCPSGFEPNDSHSNQECIKKHERVAVCPPGTSQSKSGCLKKVFVAPKVVEIRECTKGEAGC